jgi:hypothetical protein
MRWNVTRHACYVTRNRAERHAQMGFEDNENAALATLDR